MFVKPADGLKVRDPFKKDHLPAEGREVADGDLYWHRCLMDGDVILATPVAIPAAEPAADAARSSTPRSRRTVSAD